jgi:hypothetical protein
MPVEFFLQISIFSLCSTQYSVSSIQYSQEIEDLNSK